MGIRVVTGPEAGLDLLGVAAVTSDDVCVRRVAGSLLSHVRHPSAASAMIDALDDARPGTREVAAFGLGMALVMGGIGLALVLARGRLDRVDAGSPLGRASSFVPLAAAFLVFGLGIYLTIRAVAGNTTL